MPLNCTPVTTSKEAFAIKLSALAGKLNVDCGFWGGVVPESLSHLAELLQCGVLGVKSFLIHSGIDDFSAMGKDDLLKAMEIISPTGLPYLIHAELEDKTEVTVTQKYDSFLRSRPHRWEDNAIELMIDLCRQKRTRIHIVHLSSANGIKLLQAARKSGLPVTVETCPHYLTIHAESISDGSTLYKCCPPIREKENQEILWRGLKEGLIDFIVSDHSPCIPELKKMASGNLQDAWGGISSLQLTWPLMWTEAKKRGFSTVELSLLLSENVAQFAGLGHIKGKLQKGFDADLMVWDPSKQFEISQSMIIFKNKFTPYEGRIVEGRVKSTFLRGQRVFDDDKLLLLGQGRVLLRQQQDV